MQNKMAGVALLTIALAKTRLMVFLLMTILLK
nr:MAG TPA: hypothetical protein [Caudoviricetes sp.]